MTNEFKESIKTLDTENAINALTEYLKSHPEDDEALTLRGIKYFGSGKRSLAIKDYLGAIRLNPQSMAVEALKSANEILDYRNTDLINP
ncbi:MAG: hypothetical protein NC204_01340 [Candidatus Amulumruptor caecigallinarius]|nr:hypothetical protein [Candidatus Amulumruptor caecigallinarius]